ncbi:MAG: tetratricopeptide repeat protein [Chloroflexota bacterium]|nr:tetratricopeptide repeat protein [Chloroflexota bacterium]
MTNPGVVLPSGTVTMLFTDIEGSTQLVRALGTDRWEAVLEFHSQIFREVLASHGGTLVRTEGDAVFAVFTSPSAAIEAAAAAQRRLAAAAAWPDGTALRVRMGLHTGEARPATSAAGVDYVGLEVHRAARIGAAAYGGQVLVSDTTESLVRDALGPGFAFRDLGLHRFKDLVRPQRIHQLLIDGLPVDFPPLRTLDAIPNNLPTQATSFVGRERELEAALALLNKNRLLTLTGPGGSGKTRLALHVAADVVDRYPDGAWLVELAPLTDPATVGTTVAAALRISEQPGVAPVVTISESLRDQELLLILDNCEHLVAAAAELADALVRCCARLRILATSREALSVPGEALMPVPPLRVPEADPLPPLEELRQYEAVRLFVERSAAHQPSFALTPENAPEVVRICRRLDGIPLALELAAARVRALSVAQVAQRLDDRFRLLTGGGRTVAARQQTLRALIDWSHDLLGGPERIVFRRLAVFVGGWTLDAAEAVCAGDGLERAEILDILAHLVDKSLVMMRERAGVARYTMLETIREYAREKLVGSGEEAALRERHFDHFLDFVEATSKTGPWSRESQEAAAAYEDLRAAFQWLQPQPNESERELLFAGSMFGAAVQRGRVAELRRIITRALSRSDPRARTPGRARALLTAALLAGMHGDSTTAQSHSEEAIGLLRTLGQKRDLAYALMGMAGNLASDPAASAQAAEEAEAILEETGDSWGLALMRYILADTAQDRGDYAAARSGHTESLARFREIGDLQWSSNPLLSLGRIACIEGDYARARTLVEEALAIRRQRESDNRWFVAIALNSLGEVGRCEGDFAGATPSFSEALRYGRELSDDAIVSWSLHNLGHVAMQSGELRAAAGYFRESLALRRRGGSGLDVAAGLAGLAGVALREGALSEAAWLFGAANGTLEAAHGVLGPADEQVRQADLATLRGHLGDAAVAAALAAGAAATPGDVEKMTRTVARASPPSPSPAR